MPYKWRLNYFFLQNMDNTLVIFVDEVTKRLTYTLEQTLAVYGVSYELVNDPFLFCQQDRLNLVYSNYPFEERFLTISPSTLLFEEEIRKVEIDKTSWRGEEILTIDGVLDPFAALFYLLSLYDEYFIDKKDHHDRIDAQSHVMVRFGWQKKLMVERWTKAIIDKLNDYYQIPLDKKQPPFSVLPTFDIDNTYAYKLKKGTRKWLSQTKDVLFKDTDRLKERKRVLSGRQKDPYDTFDLIRTIHRDYFPVKLFWLVGSYGRFDRNISLEDPKHRSLIQSLATEIEIGLHPSYQSNKDESILRYEKELLSNCLGKEVGSSRQHFLKLKIPDTYVHLLNTKIKNDYTLGFANVVGFRAGISRPFSWFDLRNNQISELTIHPFAYMDGTLLEYLKFSPEQAKKEISEVLQEVACMGGTFAFIWHNETIGDYGKWNGWQDVLWHTINEGKELMENR